MLEYLLTIDRPTAHLFDIELRCATHGAGHIDIEFPAWSPGRYFIYDFARNVQELRACGGDGNLLRVEKIAKGTWRIACVEEQEIRVAYRMFANTLSGTFSQLDDRHASINGSSVFCYVVGRKDEPIELEIRAPKGWKSYTSLKQRRRRGRPVLQAANYDVLIDSPIEIGMPEAHRFVHDGVRYHIIIDIARAEGSRRSREMRGRLAAYAADVEKIVKAQTSAFGRPEFSDYYFLVNIDPFAPSGDGMEHLESTRLVLNGYITNDDFYNDVLDLTSHEFFHIWNVKRLRPAELGPFDYTKEHHTTLLWFAEGFTQYYGHLMVRRAGIWDDRQVFRELAEEINNVDRSPGRFHRNLRESSFDTWHAVGARNPVAITGNFRNTYVNYYHKGAVVALLLDLEIRRRTGARCSLDDVIRHLFATSYADADIGGYFLRGSGYTEQDVYDAVESVAGADARNFLERLIAGTDELEYTEALAYVGVELSRRPRRSAKKKGADGEKEQGDRPQIYTGIIVPESRERAAAEFVVVANVLPGSPAEDAGISVGDHILAVDGERVNGRHWEPVLEMKRPGERLQITFFRGSRLLTLELRTEERDTRPYRIEPMEKPTAQQRRARAKWLGPK